ncbi:MAG: DNA methylase [Armatimonadetes bacterium]|nr:DNA methylase [Armatimonadota bacterium]
MRDIAPGKQTGPQGALPVNSHQKEKQPKGIERCFDVPFVTGLARREKQIQQNYRPVIAVHKWFARRPGTLFRALLVAEFVAGHLPTSYFRSHNLKGIRVADPFMGGGTPLLEANRLGCDVLGYDINPMAYWIVRQEIQQLDLNAYAVAARAVGERLEKEIGFLYRTSCIYCQNPEAHVKYFLWVKVQRCLECHREYALFPGYLLAENRRHTHDVLICPNCGELNEVDNRRQPGNCRSCGSALVLTGPARRNRCPCPHCGKINTYPNSESGPPGHRLVAIEYHCPRCRVKHQGRFFKKPDEADLARYQQAVAMWQALTPVFVPDEQIPAGDETDRLHHWGYHYYREMFNERQLLGLELICRMVTEQKNQEVRNALATNLSDLLRYQNMLCRYDSYALKSLDIFSVHGFPVGLLQCESNLLGIKSPQGTNIGSGGWSNIVDKFIRAKEYCRHPFEVTYSGGRKRIVMINGEWIGETRECAGQLEKKGVDLRCASATTAELLAQSLDAVVTDPPYFANVQYAELMDFCYVWLRRLIASNEPCFAGPSTRNENELTGNTTMERGLDYFTQGLAQVFRRFTVALKPGAPFVFTFHHNSPEAYYPVAVALLDAGLVCTAAIPCPAEMSASIHINGTSSSIVDTVFVNRSTGTISRRTLTRDAATIAQLVLEDLEKLAAGGLKPTLGDTRCLLFGHLTRLAVWYLRNNWNATLSSPEKLNRVARFFQESGGEKIIDYYIPKNVMICSKRTGAIREADLSYGDEDDEIPF